MFAWHRKLIAKKWTYARQGPSRPRIAQEITDLVLCMARENVAWGYDRIQGALANLGYIIASNTVKNILKKHGIEPAPERAPNWNAFAERFVRSIKGECLDRMIHFGEESLRRALREYVAHYQTERNHQGVGNRLLEPLAMVSSNDETIHCRKRLGGMLSYYYREAA